MSKNSNHKFTFQHKDSKVFIDELQLKYKMSLRLINYFILHDIKSIEEIKSIEISSMTKHPNLGYKTINEFKKLKKDLGIVDNNLNVDNKRDIINKYRKFALQLLEFCEKDNIRDIELFVSNSSDCIINRNDILKTFEMSDLYLEVNFHSLLHKFIDEVIISSHERYHDRFSVIASSRFFLDNKTTLQSVANLFGISRERVRQLENNLYKRVSSKLKLRKEITSNKIYDLILKMKCNYINDESLLVEKIYLILSNILNEKYVEKLMSIFLSKVNYDIDKLKNKLNFDSVFNLENNNLLFQKIIHEKSIPPSNYKKMSLNDVHLFFNKSRDVFDSGVGSSGYFVSEKLNKKIFYESSLEKSILNLAEKTDSVIWYQEQPCFIEYEYEGKIKKYFPDLLLIDNKYFATLIEVKPLYHMVQYRNLVKLYSSLKYANKLGVSVCIIDEKGKSIDDILNYKENVSNKFHDVIINMLHTKSVLKWDDVSEIFGENKVNNLSFSKFVLENDLMLTVKPWSLSFLPENKSYDFIRKIYQKDD